MGKKWLGLVGLTIVLIIQLAMPAAIQAARPQTFSGTGTGKIDYMPDPVPLGPNTLLFAGEIVTGSIKVSDLPGMQGATLYSEHTSIVNINWTTGEIKGTMTGTFTLTAPDGSILEGTMEARQRGNIYGDISSEGTWLATTRTAVFENVKPGGNWESKFGANLRGSFSWSGKLRP